MITLSCFYYPNYTGTNLCDVYGKAKLTANKLFTRSDGDTFLSHIGSVVDFYLSTRMTNHHYLVIFLYK